MSFVQCGRWYPFRLILLLITLECVLNLLMKCLTCVMFLQETLFRNRLLLWKFPIICGGFLAIFYLILNRASLQLNLLNNKNIKVFRSLVKFINTLSDAV
jgi:Na+/H+ antiporter NhaB